MKCVYSLLVKHIEIISLADEHLAELMPIFEKIRAQDQVPCAFPIHMGAGGTVFVRCNTSRSVPLSPHVLHCHPTTHWVSSQAAGAEDAEAAPAGVPDIGFIFHGRGGAKPT